jgi:hypothetical protein
VRIKEYARRLHYPGDEDLRSWTDNFFRTSFTVSADVHAWRREWGDRGAIPEKWPSWEEGVFLPDLLLKRLKIAFLQHKSLLWSKYCRLQRFADKLLSAEAATIFRDSLAEPVLGPSVPTQGPLDRFVKTMSREDMEASFKSRVELDPAPASRSQRKLTDFGFEKVTSKQTASADSVCHKPLVDLTSDPDSDDQTQPEFDLVIDATPDLALLGKNRQAPPTLSVLNYRGDRLGSSEAVDDFFNVPDAGPVYEDISDEEAHNSDLDSESSKPDSDCAPDALDSLVALQLALDELPSDFSDFSDSSDSTFGTDLA